jgi:hypothetical protein
MCNMHVPWWKVKQEVVWYNKGHVTNFLYPIRYTSYLDSNYIISLLSCAQVQWVQVHLLHMTLPKYVIFACLRYVLLVIVIKKRFRARLGKWTPCEFFYIN